MAADRMCENEKFPLTASFLSLPLFAYSDRCVMPLGVEDKRIPPGRLTASTYYNAGYAPWYGRLNSIYSWGVRSNRHGEWFQVNFLETRVIKGVATQGRQNGNYWVKSYTIGYSVDEMTFTMYKQGRGVKVTGHSMYYFFALLLHLRNKTPQLTRPTELLWKIQLFQPLLEKPGDRGGTK